MATSDNPIFWLPMRLLRRRRAAAAAAVIEKPVIEPKQPEIEPLMEPQHRDHQNNDQGS